MEHLKGVSWCCDEDDASQVCLTSLNTVLQAMPVGQWLTLQNIFDFVLCNDLDLPIPDEYIASYVSISGEWGGRERMCAGHYPELLWEAPLVRTFFLVLAAVGAVDAVFGSPRNDGVTAAGKDYLVAADGLHAVRLTPIGEWYFRGGSEDCFEEQAAGVVTLDEMRLLIRLTGTNPVLKVALEQVAQPLGSGFYRIDGGSFLKDCGSTALVEQKVDALKSLLPDELPLVWQDFFRNLLLRINPLKPRRFTVLEVGESTDFRQLLLGDATLRKFFIMAEGGLILVRSDHRPKLKKRLKQLGYFIDSF